MREVSIFQILCQQEQAGLDAVLHIIGIKQIAERIRGNQQIAVLFLAVHPVELV